MDISRESLAAVVTAVEALTPYAGCDLEALSEEQVAAAARAAALLGRLSQVPSALLAGEVARRSQRAKGGGMARRHGHRNATQMVAKGQGGSTGQANDLITVGTLLGGENDPDAGDGAAGAGGGSGSGGADGARAPRYVHVAVAYREGRITAAQAAVITRTLDHIDGGDEDIELDLVHKATTLTLADLQRVCHEVTARWDQLAWEAREARMRGERTLNTHVRKDGMIALTGLFDPASAAPLLSWLDAQVRAGFQARRDQRLGVAEPGEAGRIRLDALVDLLRHGMRCDAPGSGRSTTVVVRIDEEALRTGRGFGTCDALGMPFSAGQLRRMLVDEAVIPLVYGGDSLALDLGRAARSFSYAQRIALAERDGGCAFCHRPVAWCDAHHIVPWSQGGRTDLDNGVLLCTRCHHRIHDDGWTIRATRTRVWFIPPASIDPDRTPRLGGRAAREAREAGEARERQPV